MKLYSQLRNLHRAKKEEVTTHIDWTKNPEVHGPSQHLIKTWRMEMCLVSEALSQEKKIILKIEILISMKKQLLYKKVNRRKSEDWNLILHKDLNLKDLREKK